MFGLSVSAVIVVLLIIPVNLPSQTGTVQIPDGRYIGQTVPEEKAKLFAPGIASTGNIEKCAQFSPDLDEFYIAIAGEKHGIIARMVMTENRWSQPELLPFSGDYFDLFFNLSPDGKRIYFTSDRPLEGQYNQESQYRLWHAEKIGNSWAVPLTVQFSEPYDENRYSPTVSNDGTIYFYTRGVNGSGIWNIYRSEPDGKSYSVPAMLGENINTEFNEFDPFVAPDESYLIFCSNGRADSYGSADLYISFRLNDETWSEAVNMGPAVNSERWEFTPFVTADRKCLFFESNRRYMIESEKKAETYAEIMEELQRELTSPGNGHSDVYWIDAGIIDDLRKKIIKQ